MLLIIYNVGNTVRGKLIFKHCVYILHTFPIEMVRYLLCTLSFIEVTHFILSLLYPKSTHFHGRNIGMLCVMLHCSQTNYLTSYLQPTNNLSIVKVV